MDSSNNNPNNDKKLLNNKRKPKFSLEEIINIYCKQHNIEDNEIQEKIKTIYYYNPEQNILIDYDKDKGDKFPLSKHIHKNPIIDELNLEEEEPKEKKEDKKLEINKKINKEKNNILEEKQKEDIKGDDLEECLICGWKFFKELTFEEKNGHINACIEGNGEKNKKELISTYKELEIFRESEENQNNNNDKDERNDKNEEKKEGDNNDDEDE